MIKSVNMVTVYETSGADAKPSERPGFIIESHPIRDGFVVLKFQDGTSYGVARADIEAAIKNACNVARY